jgi:2-oxoglutarate ferredoxin oxidoreductase subunit gamma
MRAKRATVQLCGYGGQGIILASVILGAAAVTKAGLYAVQTQSYGSEARGGECQAEVILGKEPIGSPVADRADILVAMSQAAFDRYIGRVAPGGTVMYDPQMVRPGDDRQGLQAYAVPATHTAEQLGSKLAANMVMLGFFQQATGMFGQEDLLAAIRENVRERFIEINLTAARRGIDLAVAQGVKLEV